MQLVMKTQRGDGILGFHPYFDIRHYQDGRAVSSNLQPQFTHGNSSVLISFRGWVDPRASKCG